MKEENRILEALKCWAFEDICIMEQFHEESTRLTYHVLADGKQLLIKGLPDEKTENVIKGNTLAHEYLGNQKGLAPKLIHTLDGASYIKQEDYWF